MLLATQFGFFSIIQPEPDVFQICGRRRRDLENLLGLADIEADIHVSDDSDRAFSIVGDLEDILEIVVQLSVSIEYPDFEGRIATLPDQREKLSAYGMLLTSLRSG